MQRVTTELLEVYASLFVHNWQHYAVQQRDGSYWRVAQSLSWSLLAAHLDGCVSLGTYLLDGASTCAFAVFDADSEDGLDRLVMLAGELASQGIPTILEASRRGGHLWVHFTESVAGQVVRAWLLPYAQAYSVEFYPKQDYLAPGESGSVIRLPLGIHRKSRGWYPFVEMSGQGILVPVGDTIADCCAWAYQYVQRVAVPETVLCQAAASEYVLVRNAGMQSSGKIGQDVMAPVGRGAIRAWCRAHNIVEVIGQYVALDRRGVGSCPFKEHHYRGDVRPSFQVFGGADPHWYCHTWGRAGDLFDFCCLYNHLSPQEAWERLQHGLLL